MTNQVLCHLTAQDTGWFVMLNNKGFKMTERQTTYLNKLNYMLFERENNKNKN